MDMDDFCAHENPDTESRLECSKITLLCIQYLTELNKTGPFKQLIAEHVCMYVKFQFMYVCMLKDIHTCIHIHTYMYGIGGF